MIKKWWKKLSKRKLPQFKTVRVGDYVLLATKDHQIEEILTRHKYYSQNLPRIARYIQEKYVNFEIIDIGANIGDTIALLRSFGINQQIYAIEGADNYFQILNKNLKSFQNVEPIKALLGEKTCLEKLSVEAVNGTAKLTATHETEVAVIKLDDLLRRYKTSNLKLLKIDTDGFDLKIMRGGFQTISTNKPIIFFEYDALYLDAQGEDGKQIFSQLAELGYHRILYYDNYGKFLISLTVSDWNLISQLYSYMKKGEGAFYYYDICIFHKEDDALAQQTIQKEMDFFNN